MVVNWQNLFTESAQRASSSPLRDVLRFSSDPDLISLAGGFPAPEFFPVEAFREAAELALSSGAATALQYGPTEGYMPLKSFLAQRLSVFGITVSPEEILITNGSQQGLDLVSRLLIEPGNLVAVEDPSYVGGLATFGTHQARFLVVPTDDGGMQVDALSELLQREGPKPRLIYALPNFQNPGGSTLSLARRQKLLELSYRHGIPILEDDPYGELRYEGDPVPSLKSLDVEGTVIYLGSFSKILSPGVRLGWVVAPREVIDRLAAIKQGLDLNTNSFAQHVVYQVCQTGLLEKHVERVKPIYRERRDAMLRAIAKHLPPSATWSRPEGGLFVWAQLPQGIDTRALLADALREKVAYVPGIVFHPLRDRTNGFRLNFSAVPVPMIREGVRRLGRATKEHMEARKLAGEAGAPVDLAPTV